MPGPISFGGLASGLDTKAIIDALVGAEKIPLTVLQSKKVVEDKKLSLVDGFQDLVKALQTKADALKDLGGFMSYEVTPSQEGVAKFTVTGTPQAESHTLTVNSLAAADRWSTSGVADPNADLGGGTVDFTYDGVAYSVTVGAGEGLNGMAQAINDQAGDAVTATVVNTGTETTPSYELVLTGEDTGADHAITALSVTGAAAAAVSFTDHLTTASNAEIVVDGLTVQRSTNSFAGVVDGISIDALTADVGKTISFGVTVDQGAIEEKMADFVTAYNDVMEFINDQSVYTPEAGIGGELFGDRLLTTVRNKLYAGFVAVDPLVVANDTEGYSALSLLGIKQNVDGSLEIDSAKMGDKLSANVELFSDFFTDPTTGAFTGLSESLDYLLDSMGVDGNGDPMDSLFEVRKDALNSNIENMEDDIEDMQYALNKFEENLVAKYTALEVLMGQLELQSAAVSGLASLNFGYNS